jgi:hypothetical protein
MADKNETTTSTDKPKRKRAAFTRTPKPVFAIITYTDPATGEAVKLDRDRLNIKFEKDASELVTLLTGEGMGSATVVKVELPAPTARKPAEAAPAA